MVVTVTPPLQVYHFPLSVILPRRYKRPDLYSANALCTRLCFVRFMSTHPPPDKDKVKDKEYKDYPLFSRL